jgi:hypothetical protein
MQLALENAGMGKEVDIIATEMDMSRSFLEDIFPDCSSGTESTDSVKTSDSSHELS